MIQGWDSFYVLIGGAAGALIGLMFVVATLTGGRDPSTVSRGARVYLTPVVFHFAAVLLISATVLIPRVQNTWIAGTLGTIALLGIVYGSKVTKDLCDDKWTERPDLSDKTCYGFVPLFSYIGLAITSWAVGTNSPGAMHGLAAIILLILIMGIRNAWDLVMTLAQRRT